MIPEFFGIIFTDYDLREFVMKLIENNTGQVFSIIKFLENVYKSEQIKQLNWKREFNIERKPWRSLEDVLKYEHLMKAENKYTLTELEKKIPV